MSWEQPGSDQHSLIKSKKRVADHGEVFTPDALAQRMIDDVAGEASRIDSRFLEPSCGNGNFLAPVLRRKLATTMQKFRASKFDRQHYSLLALMCCYGIELLADNVTECRSRMLQVFADNLSLDDSSEMYCAASAVVSLNILQGDALTMRGPSGAALKVAEWGYLGKGKFQRRDFRLDVLTGRASFASTDSLFAKAGHQELFRPEKVHPPMTARAISATAVPHSSGAAA